MDKLKKFNIELDIATSHINVSKRAFMDAKILVNDGLISVCSSQIFHMALKDLERSKEVIWSTFMIL